MSYVYNPFTGKLDNAGTASAAQQPQSGLASPEGSIASRYAGDIFINTATGVSYVNPVSGSTSGWEIIQTQAA